MESSSLPSSGDGASASAASTEATSEGVLPSPVGKQVAAAAASADDTDSAKEEEDTKFGFRRPDMGRETLSGTVRMYGRHVVLCFKSPSEWPAMAEGEADRLPKLLAAEIKKGQNAMARKTRLTLCEEGGIEFSNGNVLIFPDMIKYRILSHFDVQNFVEEVLIHDTKWRTGEEQKLFGSFVFVCSHGNRDRRCGVCGPVLVERFKEEIETLGLQDQVYVSASSHIGKHRYAGNIIIFSTDLNGEVTGHWYGYVTPEDVPILLKEHIGKGRVVEHLWRGQMGLSKADQKAAKNRRLLDGEIASEFVEETNEHTSPEPIEATKTDGNVDGSFNENEHTSPESIEVTKTDGTVIDPGSAGCCKGVNGTDCCQVLPQIEGMENHDTSMQETPDMVQMDVTVNDIDPEPAGFCKGANGTDCCQVLPQIEGMENHDTSMQETPDMVQRDATVDVIDPEPVGVSMVVNGTDCCCQVMPENEGMGNHDANVQETRDIVQRDVTVNGIDPEPVGFSMVAHVSDFCCQVMPQNQGMRNYDASVQETPDIVQRDNDVNNKANITKGASKAAISPKASWFGGWRKEHTYTTIAVITAIVSVAIAYTRYRQLKYK